MITQKVSQILERERIRSRKWLEDALAMPVKEQDNRMREEPRPVYDALPRDTVWEKAELEKTEEHSEIESRTWRKRT